MASIGFDPNKYEPESADRFQPIPLGTYSCVIEAEAVRPTKDNTGAYLELTLLITEGVYAKRRLFDRINLKNSNPKAVEIGLARLSSICRALDLHLLNDTTELLNRRLSVIVGLERDKVTKEATGRNVVHGYNSLPANLNHLGYPSVSPGISDVPY